MSFTRAMVPSPSGLLLTPRATTVAANIVTRHERPAARRSRLSISARPIDRARHVGRDLALARTKGARVSGGDVDHHGDRPLLACRLLLTHDPLGRHDQLPAPRDDRDLVGQEPRAGKAAAVVAQRMLEHSGIGIAGRGRMLTRDATLMEQAEQAAAGKRALFRPYQPATDCSGEASREWRIRGLSSRSLSFASAPSASGPSVMRLASPNRSKGSLRHRDPPVRHLQPRK